MFRSRYLLIVSTCLLLLGFALIIPGLAADPEQSAWAPPGLSRAQDAETKAAIKKLWEFYLEERITKDEYLLGEELFLKTTRSLDSVEKKLRSSYEGAVSGELEASKLGRVIAMIESPSQRKERLRLKQVRQEERILEGQVRELLAASKAQQETDGKSSMAALARAQELDPQNQQVAQAISGLRSAYSIGEYKGTTEFAVRAGSSGTKRFSVTYPDRTVSVIVTAELDGDVQTSQSYRRYSMSDVRKTYSSNSGRLRISISVDGDLVWREEFKGEDIAYLGRNATVWKKPRFSTPDQKTGSFEWEGFRFRYEVGSSGSRWIRSDGTYYPSGRIEESQILIKCSCGMGDNPIFSCQVKNKGAIKTMS